MQTSFLQGLGKMLLDRSIIVLFVIVFLVFGLLSPQFLTLQNLLNILVQSATLIILASGMTFVIITAGIDLSVGSIMLVVAVISGKAVLDYDLPLLVVIPLGMVLGLCFGYLNALSIHRLKIIPFIATLGMYYVARGLGLLISETRALNLPESYTWLGNTPILGIPLPVWIMAVVVFAGHIILSHTTYGRQLYAVGEDAVRARKAGVKVDRIIIGSYVLCGLCAAIASLVATAQLGAVSPTFGDQREFTAIAAVVLGGTSLFGGTGKIFPGTLIGAILIQSIESGLVMVSLDPYLYAVITAGILFFVVLIDSIKHQRQNRKSAKPLLKSSS
ncbi:MAG: ABC transporter permease [Bacteroidota bacterium]